MESKISQHVDTLIQKQVEAMRSQLEKDRKTYKKVLTGWVNTIKNEPDLKNKKVKLEFNGGVQCVCRRGYCECIAVPPDSSIKEFLEDYFQREVKEFVRNVRVEADPDCYGADYYYDCWVVFGITHEERVAEAEEDLEKARMKLRKLKN